MADEDKKKEIRPWIRKLLAAAGVAVVAVIFGWLGGSWAQRQRSLETADVGVSSPAPPPQSAIPPEPSSEAENSPTPQGAPAQEAPATEPAPKPNSSDTTEDTNGTGFSESDLEFGLPLAPPQVRTDDFPEPPPQSARGEAANETGTNFNSDGLAPSPEGTEQWPPPYSEDLPPYEGFEDPLAQNYQNEAIPPFEGSDPLSGWEGNESQMSPAFPESPTSSQEGAALTGTPDVAPVPAEPTATGEYLGGSGETVVPSQGAEGLPPTSSEDFGPEGVGSEDQPELPAAAPPAAAAPSPAPTPGPWWEEPNPWWERDAPWWDEPNPWWTRP